MQIAPTQDDVFTSLKTVLGLALPAGRSIVRGQANRVPTPKATGFCVMTPIRRARLETNTQDLADCRVVGSVAGTTLTVESITFGEIVRGLPLYGPGVTAGTLIRDQIDQNRWLLSAASTVPSGTVMGCGGTGVIGPHELTVQIDVYGQGATGAPADDAQTIAILLRDDWAVQRFKEQAATTDSVVPLYAEDPQQVPMIDGESQYEDRWIVMLHLQVNERVLVPQQFMDEARVTLIDADAEYPA